MEIPTIKPEWRTSDVVALCQGMRESQDFGAMPILADAIQEAGCEDELLLAELRHGPKRYTEYAPLVASIWSEKGASAVVWLRDLHMTCDCPEFRAIFAAATDHHEENDVGSGGPYDDYYISRNEDGYLYFGGTDAHGEIPESFWDYVELASGKKIPNRDRASYFSCSC